MPGRRLPPRDASAEQKVLSLETVNQLFDTVRDPRLRSVLESDYHELQKALLNDMHKASLVLAGGIVEAVLMNYLAVIGYTGKDPKQMQLHELIAACEKEGALTAETAALCQALREYRNLIHPGRSVRKEELPDLERAEVAEKVVERVVGDVGGRIRGRPEWAAEAAFEAALKGMGTRMNENAMRRLVCGLPSPQAARLVVEVIPDRFASMVGAWTHDAGDYMDFFFVGQLCFREGLQVVPAAVRIEAAHRLLGELNRCLNDEYAAQWLAAFFSVDLLAALEGSEREDLINFVVQTLSETGSSWVVSVLDGVGPYLSPSAARELVRVLAPWTATDDESSADLAGRRGR